MQAKRRRDRKRGGGASASAATAAASSAAARDTSDELTASAAGPVVPFRGFSAEYVRAHRKMGNEAIRRLNIMIDLLKSGKMTEKQIKTMLPMRKPSQLIISIQHALPIQPLVAIRNKTILLLLNSASSM